MKKNLLKKTIIIVFIIMCIWLGESSGVLPHAVARITSSIYVTINYSSEGLKFQSVEYAYGFGEYFVSYADKEGKRHGFMLYPKEFPIFLRDTKGEG